MNQKIKKTVLTCKSHCGRRVYSPWKDTFRRECSRRCNSGRRQRATVDRGRDIGICPKWAYHNQHKLQSWHCSPPGSDLSKTTKNITQILVRNTHELSTFIGFHARKVHIKIKEAITEHILIKIRFKNFKSPRRGLDQPLEQPINQYKTAITTIITTLY